MTDLLVDESTHDFVLESGDFKFTTPEELIRQRLEITLLAFKGEWFRNKSYGIPYLKNEDNNVQLLERGTEELLKTTLKREILSSPGIERLVSFVTSKEPLSRKISVSFVAEIEGGSQIKQTVVI